MTTSGKGCPGAEVGDVAAVKGEVASAERGVGQSPRAKETRRTCEN